MVERDTSGSSNVQPFELPGMGTLPAAADPEAGAFFRNLIDSFNRSAETLQSAYEQLQRKFDQLNMQLEATNRELTVSLTEQERLSSYLTNILESLSSGVLVVDTSGLITLFNRGAETITGISGDDAIDRPYLEVMGNGVPEELTPLQVLKTGRAETHREKTIVSENGGAVPVGFSVSPLVGPSGELLGAVEIFMDLTRIKALEDELAWKEKLAALGQMSATMAHKIRNPLGGIVGYAGLLGKSAEDERSQRFVGKITEGVEKIDHIITSVLTYNAPLELSLRTFGLGARMEETIRLFRSEHAEDDGRNIGFRVNVPAADVSVEADPDQFAIAITAILANAVEAIESDGSITVTVFRGSGTLKQSHPMAAKLIKVMHGSSRLLATHRPCGIVIITDTGEGMNEETLKNLYVPFYTTRENGIGLGLALARKIVDGHHGELWIESMYGQGTAVGLIIPERSTVTSG